MQRISKTEAKRRFTAGEEIWLCPSKLRQGWPWFPEYRAKEEEFTSKALDYVNHEILWEGTVAETAWQLMYRGWAFYNTNYEMGYYAHYYVG